MVDQFDCAVPGDFDEDGDIDLVLGGDGGAAEDFALVLLNDGTGEFTTILQHELPEVASNISAADLNGDGHLDLLTWGWTSDRIVLSFGNGDGTFDAWTSLSGTYGARYWDVGDLDADGDLDVVANEWQLVVIRNNGDGTFEDPESSFGSGSEIMLTDMNNDSVLDAIMIAPSGSEYVAVLQGAGSGVFRVPQRLPADSDLFCLVVDDVDNDGDQDVVTGFDRDPSPGELQVSLNSYPGGFDVPVSYYPGINPTHLVAGDLNQDGSADLLVLDRDNRGLATMFNVGDGSYLPGETYVIGYNPQAAAIGDLDGNGSPDVAVIHQSGNFLGILLNTGDGTFGPPSYYDATRRATGIVLGDLDGDGDLDVAVEERSAASMKVIVVRNNGNGTFASPELYDATDPAGIALGDFDGDSDLDLATGSVDGDVVSVLLNNGNGTYAPAVTYVTNHDYGWRLSAGDMDLDGTMDLVFLGYNSWNVTILPGNGDGTFASPLAFATGWRPYEMTLADLDNDQDLELLLVDDHEGLSIIYNNASDLVPTGLLVTGPGPGEFNPTLVRVYGVSAGRSMTEWSAYGVDRWGVNVALGELDGTPGTEVLTGAGPGAVFGPHVRGFQHDGTPLPGVSFFAYGTNKWGVNVCSGDLDADGYDEIVTGAGPGAVFGPHVRGWNWDGAGTPTPIPGISYFAYGTPKWGVNVSCGDIDGDGFDEIVTGAGPGAVYGPHVRGWNCDGGGAAAISGVSFLAYGTNKYGVNVCCGDIDGDGIDEMVTGAGPGAVFGPHVRGWNWDGSGSAQAIPAVSFFAYSYTQWGVNVSCGDLDDDGIDEIITGPGPGETHAPRVRGWNYDGQTLTVLGGVDFNAYDTSDVTHGVKVGGLRN